MNRFYVFIVSIVACVAASAQSVYDVNRDGKVSMADANEVVNAYLGKQEDVVRRYSDMQVDSIVHCNDSLMRLVATLRAELAGGGANANRNVMDIVGAQRLEMPAFNGDLMQVLHYIRTTETDSIMNLAIEWNPTMRHSTWVAFSWDSTTSQDIVERGKSFKWDPLVPADMGKITDAEHKSDGYDVGHLCASEDRVWCREANDQTFYYTNTSPQMSSFNQRFWLRMEERAQKWGRSTQVGRFDTVYVAKGGDVNCLLKNFTGQKAGSDKVIPTTNEEGYTPKNLAVPMYYYMALLAVKDGVYQAIGFYIPHREDLPSSPTLEEVQSYAMSIDQLENITGIDFFCNLPDVIENEVESQLNLGEWDWE